MSPSRSEPRASTIVVAAGRGERFGAADKVVQPLGGRPLLAHALDAVEAATSVDEVVLVVAEHSRAAIERLLAAEPRTKPVRIVEGGARRQDSVERGLLAMNAAAEIVVVHDG